MLEIRDKVKGQLYNRLVDCCFEQPGTSDKAIKEFVDKQILSIPELAKGLELYEKEQADADSGRS